MNWPSYGHRVLRSILRGALEGLEPAPTMVVVIADRRVADRTLATIEGVLEKQSWPSHRIRWWASEANKTLAQAENFARAAIRAGADRQSLILAVGGGVTTDIAGLVAATLMRGVRWGAVPTTLLGMVDAALGGKTAVDLPEGKNLVGAFHPPEFVLCDVETLHSLPPREWRCGLGEVIKSALIGVPEILTLLEETPPKKLLKPGSEVLELARASGELKMRIVLEDPYESRERKVLNLGHTFGHALETAAGYKKLAHGEAVALGIRCAMLMSEEFGILEAGLGGRVRALIHRLGLPGRFPGPLPSRRDLARLMRRDKKAKAGRLDLILPVKPGECLLLTGVEPAVAVSALYRELDG